MIFQSIAIARRLVHNRFMTRDLSLVPRGRPGAADIASLLRREIVGGSLSHQDALPSERRLAEHYAVSRGTVREALARLEREGLVETRRGSGTYVAYSEAVPAGLFESASPLELMDARFALEPHICRLGVLHGRLHHFDRLEELLARMEASLEAPGDFADADTEFHARLAETTGNSLLIWIIRQINLVRSRGEWTRMTDLTLSPAMIAAYNAQHRAIVEALRERRADDAAVAMKQHLETARLSLTRTAAT
jgi:DNA-binding FadR family transcriptional regulator